MLFRGLGILGLGLIVAGPATAQTFSNTIFFGDSRTDSGYFLYKPLVPGNPKFGLAPAGTGTWTTNPGSGWAAAFGQKFGIAVTPSDTPVTGGNNYAIGGARVAIENAAGNIFSTNTQIQTYFANTGGVADPNALYIFWIGVNDLKNTTVVPNLVNPQNTAGILALANQAIGQVASLANAGARYFLVPRAFPGKIESGGYFHAGANMIQASCWEEASMGCRSHTRKTCAPV
jgi:outer membrane lipase/esterase